MYHTILKGLTKRCYQFITIACGTIFAGVFEFVVRIEKAGQQLQYFCSYFDLYFCFKNCVFDAILLFHKISYGCHKGSDTVSMAR